MSFLAIDVGNTRLKWAQFEGATTGAPLLAQGFVFLEMIHSLASTQWLHLTQPSQVLGCVVAGDKVKREVEEQLELWDASPQWVVSKPQACGVVNGYDQPVRLGSDRFIALIGARHRVLLSGRVQPALVVMVGTAVTVDALDGNGKFVGGYILPGFGLMQRALEIGTAAVKAPTGEIHDFPTNTSDALMSGSVNALAGAIERMHMKLTQRCGHAPQLFMTGGGAPKLAPFIKLPFEIVDTLIFEGLLQWQEAQNKSVAAHSQAIYKM